MSAVKDGGPAFPVITEIVVGHDEWGNEVTNEVRSTGGSVSVRDYFAAKAMQAAATNYKGANGFTFDERAQWAYMQADAMLRAREAKP